MSNVYMTVSDESNERKGDVIYEYSENIAGGSVGNTIMLPDEAGKIESILVSLIITSGAGYVQYTNSKRADVVAGNADWLNWSPGTITADDEVTLYPVTAVRGVMNSGSGKINVRAI